MHLSTRLVNEIIFFHFVLYLFSSVGRSSDWLGFVIASALVAPPPRVEGSLASNVSAVGGRGTRKVTAGQPTWPGAREEGGGSKAADLAVAPREEGSRAINGSEGSLKVNNCFK